MGWTDSHLHRFQPGSGPAWSVPYFITEFDEEEEGGVARREALPHVVHLLVRDADVAQLRPDPADGRAENGTDEGRHEEKPGEDPEPRPGGSTLARIDVLRLMDPDLAAGVLRDDRGVLDADRLLAVQPQRGQQRLLGLHRVVELDGEQLGAVRPARIGYGTVVCPGIESGGHRPAIVPSAGVKR